MGISETTIFVKIILFISCGLLYLYGQITIMKNEEVNIEYWFDKSQTVRKSIILYKMKDGVAWPVMYLTKPKWIDDEEFMELFKRMQIYIAS